MILGGKCATAGCKKTTSLDVTWNNRLALMYGTGSMGFRFDMILDEVNEKKNTTGGKIYDREVTGKAAIGFT